MATLGFQRDRLHNAARSVVANAGSARLPASVAITHRERMMFPDAGVTKGELADYYTALSDSVLPWAAKRPLTLVRCPQGRDEECFYQKHDAGTFGPSVKAIPIREKDGEIRPSLFIDDEVGLLTCVQMGAIEFHTWGSRVDDLERPDRLVMDLDPDEDIGFEPVRQAALEIRGELLRMNLTSYAMQTGGKGLHLLVPIKPRVEWPVVKDFAGRLASAEAIAHPTRFTDLASKARRRGRVYLDYLRNTRGATAIVPYSVRAKAGAPVAAPITWDELERPEGPIRWHIQDIHELKRRAASPELTGWGRAEQDLPDL